MSGAWRVSAARPGEGRLAAALARRSLEPRLRPLTIWESPRAARYVESLLSNGPRGDARFFLLRRGRRVAGMAAFRMLDGQPFLNHLYVERTHRGRCLGARLLAEAFEQYLAGRPGKRLRLDVFAGREPAESWYARLGFVERETLGWWVAPNDAHPIGGAACLAGLAEAGRRRRAWGFSLFTAGRYRVGRLWAPYFRLSDRRAAVDARLRAALRALDPRRRLLLVAPGEAPGDSWKRVAVSRRLEIPAASLLDRLRRRLCLRGAYV